MAKFNEKTMRIEDNGMLYEIKTWQYDNSPLNIKNGGKPILSGQSVHKVKKDGTLGFELGSRGLSARIGEVIKTMRTVCI